MRIHLVKKARKEHYCRKCGGVIGIGDSYRWWKHKFAARTCWHEKHGPPGSADLTTSEKLSTCYSIVDTIGSLAGDLSMFSGPSLEQGDPGYEEALAHSKEELIELLENTVLELEGAYDEAQDVGYEYESGADNIEEYFGETEQVSEMREKAYAIEEWCQEIDSARENLEEILYTLREAELTWESLATTSMDSCAQVEGINEPAV